MATDAADGVGGDEAPEEKEAWVDFLNVDGAPIERALGRRLEGLQNLTALILCANGERADALNAGLWTFDQGSFLPHGSKGEGAPADHPIWIDTAEPEAVAFAPSLIVSVDDAAPADWERYERRWRVFDARDPAQRDAGRVRWMAWRDAGKSLAYWTFDGKDWRLERRG